MVLTVTRRLQIDPNNPTSTQPAHIRDFAWTLDCASNQQTGAYFNGRVWIMDSGSLHCTARSPEQVGTGTARLHGTQKNVRGSALKHGVDGRDYPNVFDDTLGVGGVGASISLAANDVLMSTYSRTDTTAQAWRAWPGPSPGSSLDRPGCTDSAAVLYVVSAPPAADAFAPPWGGDPTQRASFSFTFSQVRQHLLPRLIYPSWAGAATAPINSELIFWLQTEWMDLCYSWDATATEGWSNAPNYGQLRANLMSMTALKICMNQDAADPLHASQQLLLKHFIQHAIDYAGLAFDGKRHDSNGGHTCGRKAAVIIAGKLLGDSRMSAPIAPPNQTNTGTSAAPTGHWFQEDTAHYMDDVLTNNWKGGPGSWRYNLDGLGDNGPAMDVSQFTGYQHLNPSLWGTLNGNSGIGFHEGNSYYPANHEEKVGQTVVLLAMKCIGNWDGTISHTRGHRRTVPTVTGTPADISYGASLPYFSDMVRFMSPRVPEIDNALANTAGYSLQNQRQGGSTAWAVSGSPASKQFARDCWAANFPLLGQTEGWYLLGQSIGVLGPELPAGAMRGCLNRPLMWTITAAASSASVTFQIWSGLTPLNLPPGVTISSTKLESGFPQLTPTIVIGSDLLPYYLWFAGFAQGQYGSGSGQVPPVGVEGGSGAALGETTLTNPDATNGWTSATVTLPAAQTAQTWYVFQVIFNLSDGTQRATNAMACLI